MLCAAPDTMSDAAAAQQRRAVGQDGQIWLYSTRSTHSRRHAMRDQRKSPPRTSRA